jgi:hypothetical protein
MWSASERGTTKVTPAEKGRIDRNSTHRDTGQKNAATPRF